MRPYSIVENDGFQNLLHTLEPRYSIPSRPYIAETVIPNLYNKVKSRVISELKEVSFVSITTDSWTSRATQNYVAVTAHFIDNSWASKNYTLQTKQLSESHTGGKLAEELKSTIQDWNLTRNGKGPAISTDNASNIMSGVKIADLFPHVTCFAHTLNLATQRGLKVPQMERLLGRVRKIVTFFHKSTTATAMLKAKQLLLQIPTHRLILDVSTRWNSTFDMLQIYTEQQAAIYAALMSQEVKKNVKDVVTLSDGDVSVMEEIIILLEPIKTITTLMCDEKFPTVSLIHPFKERLLQHLQVKDSDSTIVKAVKTAISSDLQPRFKFK